MLFHKELKRLWRIVTDLAIPAFFLLFFAHVFALGYRRLMLDLVGRRCIASTAFRSVVICCMTIVVVVIIVIVAISITITVAIAVTVSVSVAGVVRSDASSHNDIGSGRGCSGGNGGTTGAGGGSNRSGAIIVTAAIATGIVAAGVVAAAVIVTATSTIQTGRRYRW